MSRETEQSRYENMRNSMIYRLRIAGVVDPEQIMDNYDRQHREQLERERLDDMANMKSKDLMHG